MQNLQFYNITLCQKVVILQTLIFNVYQLTYCNFKLKSPNFNSIKFTVLQQNGFLFNEKKGYFLKFEILQEELVIPAQKSQNRLKSLF